MIIYGNYFPMKKSEAFISAMNSMQGGGIKTLNDFFRNMSVPLDIKSSVGEEEIVRQLMSISANLIQQNDNSEVTNAIMEYTNIYTKPILERHKGLNFGQDLYLAGSLNLAAYQKTYDEKYLNAAKNYFEEFYAWAPNRPQPLYGLFDIYRIQNDKEKVKFFGDTIVKNWPNADDVKKVYEEFLNAKTSTTSEKK